MRFSWVVFGSLLLVGLGLGPAHAFKECDNCPEMVEVPTGSFMMGSPANEAGRLDREGPQHSVMIAKPFVLGKFHVTVDEFAAFAADTGYDPGTKCNVLEGGKYEE